MRVKVLKIYRDKYKRTLHKVNEIQEISKERCREINGTARGIFVEEIKPKRTPKKK